jgi:hypothetical protein
MGCLGPYAGVDCNLTVCPLQSRLQQIYHGRPYARVDLNPMQQTTLSPIRDFGFCLWLYHFSRTVVLWVYCIPVYTYRETRERCPLLIVETDMYEDLKSTNVRGPSLVGSYKIFFSSRTLFPFLCPHHPAGWAGRHPCLVACLLVCVSECICDSRND